MKNIILLFSVLFLSACEPWPGRSSNYKVAIPQASFTTDVLIHPTTAYFNPLPASAVVTFESNVSMSTVTSDDLILTGTGSCSLNPLLSYSISGHQLTVLLNTISCVHGDKITLKIRMDQIQNMRGQPGEGIFEESWTLNTDNAPAPSLNITTGTFSVFPGTFSMIFDSTIDMTSVTPSLLTLYGTGHCPSSPLTSFTQSGQTVTVTYDSTGCLDGNSIKAVFNFSTITDLNGRPGAGIIEKELTLDTVGVDSSAVTVQFASGDVNPLPSSVLVTFPSDVDMDSIQLSDYVITGTGSCPVSALQGLVKNGQDVTLSIDTASCVNGNEIQFMLPMSTVNDHSGNPGTGMLTANWRLINTLPAAPVFNILSGTVAVLPTAVVLQFDDSINISSLNPNSVWINGAGSCPANALSSIFANGSAVTLNINTSTCSNGSTISVELDMSQVTNSVGMSGSGMISRMFTLDSSGPVAPVINVDSGTFAQLPQSILLTFPSDTDMTTVNTSSIEVTGTGACQSNALSALTISGTSAQVSLDTTGCLDTNTLKLSVHSSMIKDHVGNSGSGLVERTFLMDSTVPGIPVMNIAAGLMRTLPSSLSMTFDNTIDMATVGPEDFIVQGSGNCPVSPLSNYSETASQVDLTLDQTGCGNNDYLVVTLDMSGIQNTLGVSGSGTMRSFFILDNEGPALPTLNRPGGIVASIPSTYNFVFPTDTDMATVTIADFAVTGSCASIVGVAKTDHTATLTVDGSNCTNNDTASVKAIMSGISDTLGNPGVGEASVSYTIDAQGPALPVINPVTATLASLPSNIIATFSQDTLMSSVTTADFQVSGTGSCTASVSTFTVNGQAVNLALTYSGCSHTDVVTVSISGAGITDSFGNAGTSSVSTNYTLDNLGINAGSVSIAPASATLISLPLSIAVIFPSDTNMASVDASDFSSTTNGTCPSSVVTGVTVSGQVATVVLNTFGCISGNAITVGLNMNGVSDSVGNTGSGMTFVSYTLDNIGPAAAVFNVTGGTKQILSPSIVSTFPNDTDMNSVSSLDFNITGTGACAGSSISSLITSGQTVTATLNTSSCASGESLTFTLNMSGVTDALGNAGTSTVTVTQVLDNVGPATATTTAVSGTLATLASSMAFTFSSDTDMSSVSVADFTGTGTGSCLSNPVTSLSTSGQVATVHLNTSGCALNNSVTVSLNMAGVTDAIGNAGSGTVSVTQTLDNQGPATATTSAVSGTVAAFPASMNFTFPNDTDMTSVTAADFTGSGTGTCASNPISSISKSGFVATVNVNTSGCGQNNAITIALNMSGVTDSLGNAGSGSVSVTQTLDSVGPATATTASVSATLATLPTTIAFTFANDTDMNSVTVADFSGSGTGTCAANPVSSISKSGFVATVNMTTSGCGQNHAITVTLNMSGVTDAIGNAGSGTVSRTFTLDSVGPSAATIGTSTATLTSLPTSVNVTFTSDTDMNSVVQSDFTVSGTGTCPASVLSGISKSGQVATLTLNTSGCLHTNAITVSLNMANVTDAVGNVGSGTISAVYTLDTVGPANPTSNPAGGVVALLPLATVITFSADTDMSTVTVADLNLTVAGVCGAATISNFTKSGQTASVTITSSCVLGTVNLNVDMTGIKDTTGNSGTGTFTVGWVRVL